MSNLNQTNFPAIPTNISSSFQEEDDFVHVMEVDDDPPLPPAQNVKSEDGAVADTPLSSAQNVKSEDDTPILPALNVKLTPRYEVIGLKSPYNGSTQICATVKANAISEDDSARAPVDIVVVLDVSGSMKGEKLELCKKTCELLLRELRPQDRFGLVTFSSEARLEIPARKLDEATKHAVLRKIKTISARGSTNLSGGIGMGAREMRAIEEPNSVRSMFVLTDGYANRGISDPKGIVELTTGCLGKPSDGVAPITVHTFGYGTSHDETLLQDVSQATTGGTYYFVESDSDVASAFGDALGGVLSVLAQNVVLSISTPPGLKLIKVHHDNATMQEDGSCKVDLGDFYAEESRDVIFEVALRSDEKSSEKDDGISYAMANVSYLDTIKKELVDGGTVSANIKRPDSDIISPPNTSVVVQWLRTYTANGMEEADQLSRCGDLRSAREKITSLLGDLRRQSAEASAQSDPLILQLISDLNEVHLGFGSKSSYEAYGGKTMKRKYHAHRRQRCAESAAEVSNTYRSSRKKLISEKMKSNVRTSSS